jgi:hypothetical protein
LDSISSLQHEPKDFHYAYSNCKESPLAPAHADAVEKFLCIDPVAIELGAIFCALQQALPDPICDP